MTILRMIFGDFDYDEISQVDKGSAALLFISFMVVVNLVLLNIFLAIVIDAYESIKTKQKADMNVGDISVLVVQEIRFLVGRDVRTIDYVRLQHALVFGELSEVCDLTANTLSNAKLNLGISIEDATRLLTEVHIAVGDLATVGDSPSGAFNNSALTQNSPVMLELRDTIKNQRGEIAAMRAEMQQLVSLVQNMARATQEEHSDE